MERKSKGHQTDNFIVKEIVEQEIGIIKTKQDLELLNMLKEQHEDIINGD